MDLNPLFSKWKEVLGKDFHAYRNHVLRLLQFYEILHKQQASKAVQVAAFFHDLGIWSHGTFDYLKPSIDLAEEYLNQQGDSSLLPMVTSLILEHHKITPYRQIEEVENFRKADLIDLSFGVISFGLSATEIKQVRTQYPNQGFHKKLLILTGKNIIQHPLKPLPMFHW